MGPQSIQLSMISPLSLIDVSPSTTSLCIAIAITTYLSHRCITPPNPAPRRPYPTDTLFALRISHQIAAFLGTTIQLLIWTYYIIVLLLLLSYQPSSRPDPPLHPLNSMCLHPSLLNPILFTWSHATVLFITAILVFAPLRISAYHGLGPSFTFELAAPTKLVTSGLYAYVQHPSYTGLMVVQAANQFFLQRLDGVLACVLPGWWLGLWMADGGEAWRWWVQLLVPVGISALFGVGLWVRVMEEEEMMRKEFGKEWEEWHARTSRFVPWLI